jgi:hypothetical protein
MAAGHLKAHSVNQTQQMLLFVISKSWSDL